MQTPFCDQVRAILGHLKEDFCNERSGVTFDPLVIVAGPEGDDPLNEEAGYEVQKVLLLSPALQMNKNKKY